MIHRVLIAFTVAAVTLNASAADPDPGAIAGNLDLTFTATLDGSPIGQHRFVISRDGDTRRVESTAKFTVKILGITAYRYQHHASEQWRGDCLTAMDSTTDDDGKATAVHAEQKGDKLDVKGTESEVVDGCVMSFAYWNPVVQKQKRLLNAQSGKLEEVELKEIGKAPIDVRGRTVQATGYRISGTKHPIEVWYGPDGDWVALDSVVTGDRKLAYRLR